MKLLVFPSLEFFELSLDFDEEVFRGVFSPLVVTMKFQVYPKTPSASSASICHSFS